MIHWFRNNSLFVIDCHCSQTAKIKSDHKNTSRTPRKIHYGKSLIKWQKCKKKPFMNFLAFNLCKFVRTTDAYGIIDYICVKYYATLMIAG